jgi:hypothetical protein
MFYITLSNILLLKYHSLRIQACTISHFSITSGLSITFVFLNAVSKTHTRTSIKTCDFVTFYKFLIHLGVHHTMHHFINEIVDIAVFATQIPLSIFTSLFYQRFEKHSMLKSMHKILQQFYIQMETEPDDFYLFFLEIFPCTP